MKNIAIFITKLFPKEIPKPMGRWRNGKSDTQMNTNIDLSNEDHCGPCGQYALTMIEKASKLTDAPKESSAEKLNHFGTHHIP